VLVVGQLAICIGLMAFAFLIQKQTRYMISMDTGYAMDELVTIPLNMHIGEGIFNERFEVFAQELKKYNGIKNVSLAYSSPSSIGTDAADVNWEGKTDGQDIWMNWESISYDYFETIGVKVKQGRSFGREFQNDEINWKSRQGAFILNERAVHEMGIDDPIGKEFGVWGFRGPIVGVVEDYNFKSMHSGISPLFYMMSPFYLNEIVVRIDPATPSALADIKTVWDQFVIEYPLEVFHVKNQVRALYTNDQKLARLLYVFSMLAILIACMGLFSLTVMSMDQRIKEIGIRKVNGASTLDIFIMLNKEYTKLVGFAFVLTTTVSWYAIQEWLDNFAYKTQMSWWIFGLAGVLVLGIALITVSWKSWRVAEVNPVETLRHE
jgi:putative ABC transport system permease protein